jgi:lysozyme
MLLGPAAEHGVFLSILLKVKIMKINKETLNLIKEFEGCELKAYKDAVGVWTIGYGHTAAAGNPKPVSGMVITAKQAEDLLLKDLVKYENAVKKYVKVPLTDNQYGALVSFTYNLGEGNFSKSTLLKKVNAKDFAGAANEFAKWNKAGGKVLNGLTRRRAAEAALFKRPGNGTSVSLVTVDDPGTGKPANDVVTPAPVSFWASLVQLLLKLFRGGK